VFFVEQQYQAEEQALQGSEQNEQVDPVVIKFHHNAWGSGTSSEAITIPHLMK
jgi:hypothetical protein